MSDGQIFVRCILVQFTGFAFWELGKLTDYLFPPATPTFNAVLAISFCVAAAYYFIAHQLREN